MVALVRRGLRSLRGGSETGDGRAENALQLLERKRVRVRVEGCNAVSRDLDGIVAIAGVGGGVKDADVGAVAHDDDLFGLELGQAFVQVRLEEGAVAAFRDDFVGEPSELGDNVRLLGAPYAVRREHLKLFVVGIVSVADEDDVRADGLLAL